MNTTKLLGTARILNNIPSVVRTSERCLSTTADKLKSFKVQDVADFNEKVKNSKTPVIVDFFAT